MDKVITTFSGHPLNWHMNFYVVIAGNHQKSLYRVRSGLVYEFMKHKYELQCIIELKEIKKMFDESLSYFNQRFKNLVARYVSKCLMSNIENGSLLSCYHICVSP